MYFKCECNSIYVYTNRKLHIREFAGLGSVLRMSCNFLKALSQSDRKRDGAMAPAWVGKSTTSLDQIDLRQYVVVACLQEKTSCPFSLQAHSFCCQAVWPAGWLAGWLAGRLAV